MPGWRPELVHVHDWQAALTPVYMRYRPTPELPSVLTIHNIAFQGQFGAGRLSRAWSCRPMPTPWKASNITAISASSRAGCRRQPQSPRSAPPMRSRSSRPNSAWVSRALSPAASDNLHGIVNGIDADIWNPKTDPMIARHYDSSTLKERQRNRKAIVEHFALDDDDGPIFCVVSRLTWQKGMDLLAGSVEEIVAMGGKLAILGSGDAALEGALLCRSRRTSGPRRYGRRLQRAAVASDAGRLRRHHHSIAVRAVRADAALWPALRLRADRGAHRRP